MGPSRIIGRFALFDALGSGGTASVHLGVDLASSVPVAVKRLHESEAEKTLSVARLLDEVRLARHIAHPNVVRVVELVADGDQMLAVMEYVHGEPLSRLLVAAKAAGTKPSPRVVGSIVVGLLLGLHAAHGARGEDGAPLALVHRDVTPDNVLVGEDGVTRITDFGVAKAEGRLNVTRDGGVKGKLAYLAPEQIGGEVSKRTDVYAAALVMWEALVGERPIQGETEAAMVTMALDPKIPPASSRGAAVPPALDAAIARALALAPDARFPTAFAFAEAIAFALPLAGPSEVGAWVRSLAAEALDRRAATIASVAGPPRRSRRSLGVAILALAAVSVVIVWAVVSWKANATAVARAASATATAIATASATATATASATPTAIPTPTATPTASATPTDTDAHDGGTARAAKPRAARPASSAKCEPPWYFDSLGIRRYDPKCMP